jgi:hypothetical protein
MLWVEASALGHAMRESGPWTYAVVNLAHVAGVAAFFGAVLVLDLRLVGLWRRVPLAMVSAVTQPVVVVGLGLAMVTGIALLATKATDYTSNPFIYVKFPALGVGLANALWLTRSQAWRAVGVRDLSPVEGRQLAVMGGISLLSWSVTVAAGRLVGYW